MKVCPTPGCPTLVRQGKCSTCSRAADAARGTTTERGYGWKHQKRRAELLANLKPGTPCPRCGRPMHPGDALDAGHSTPLTLDAGAVADRLECASCNRSDGGRLRHQLDPTRYPGG